MNSEVTRPTEQLFLLSDKERRRLVGNKFNEWLKGKGITEVVYFGNIPDALPLAARDALKNHAVPPSAYEGRVISYPLLLFAPFNTTVVLGVQPLVTEIDFWSELYQKLGTPFPKIKNTFNEAVRTEERQKVFVYPFIGTDALNKEGVSIPSAERFNNKAYMRALARKIGLKENIVPGMEIFYNNESIEEFVQSINHTVVFYYNEKKKPLLIKLGNTASGLLTVRVDKDTVGDDNNISQLTDLIYNMFVYDQQVYPGDVVIEELVDFGKEKGGLGDFSIRGFITPQGGPVIFSIGRVISDPRGEYLGMVMTKTNNSNELRIIGLHPETLRKMAEIFEKLAGEMYNQGYWGPVSFDFFAEQENPSMNIQVHDYNIREGGTSTSGLVNSVAETVWGESTPVLDIELKLTGRKLAEQELNEALRWLHGEEVVPYATTFLRFPQVKNNNYFYTLKVICPYRGLAQTDEEVASQISGLVNKLNKRLPLTSVVFQSPL